MEINWAEVKLEQFRKNYCELAYSCFCPCCCSIDSGSSVCTAVFMLGIACKSLLLRL